MANTPADPKKNRVNTRKEVERRDLPVNQTITLPSAEKPAEPPKRRNSVSRKGTAPSDGNGES